MDDILTLIIIILIAEGQNGPGPSFELDRINAVTCMLCKGHKSTAVKWSGHTFS
jgi:hypothetical protein